MWLKGGVNHRLGVLLQSGWGRKGEVIFGRVSTVG